MVKIEPRGPRARELDAATLARACDELGAGEILLNCIDKDGTNYRPEYCVVDDRGLTEFLAAVHHAMADGENFGYLAA